MTKKGYTLVEILVALIVLSIISVVTSKFLFQTLTTKDKHNATVEATQQARLVKERIVGSVKRSVSIIVEDDGKVLKLTGNSLCETYSLSGSMVYYDSSPPEVNCPVEPSINTPLMAGATVTNLTSPAIVFFEGLPSDNPVGVKIRLRVKVEKPLASSQVLIEEMVTKRQ